MIEEIGDESLRLHDERAAHVIVDCAARPSGPTPAWTPSPDEIAAIVAAGAGHPGRLVALTAAARGAPDDARVDTVRNLAAQPLDALTEHLLTRLDPATRRLLDDVVVLTGATGADLVRLGNDGVDSHLGHLVGSGLVDPPRDLAGEFRPHRVAADAVAAQPERLRDRARPASRVAIENGDVRGALRAARHGDAATIADSLSAFGDRVIEEGEPRLVVDAVAALPPEDRADFHGLVGRAHQALGEWQRALDCFEAAATIEVTAADAWRHGLIQYLQGDLPGARVTYRRALEADEGSDGPASAMLAGYAGAAAWLAGDADGARDLSRRALALATTSGSSGAMAVAHTGAALVAASDGDRTGNEWHYGRALQHAEAAGDLLQIARIRSNRGSRLMEEGDFNGALVELDRAVRAADVGSYGAFLAVALSNRGEVLTKLGRLDEARTDLATSVGLFQSQGSRLVSYPLAVLARLFVARGDYEQALGACERATQAARDTADRQLDVAVAIQLARALAERDPDRAAAVIDAATGAAAGSLDEAELWTVVADVARRRGDVEQAADAADRARGLARSRHDRFALASALEIAALVASDRSEATGELDEARSIFAELGCVLDAARVGLALAAHEPPVAADARATAVLELARRLGARPLARAAEDFLRRHDDDPVAALSVTLLGSFAVARRDEPIPLTAWQSKKARTLFKMLVARAGRPIARDQAIDRLWPDDDPAKVANRLSAALATIRSVLDPDKEFDSEHYVRADGEAIVLDASAVDVDVIAFLDAARAGLQARPADDTVVVNMLTKVEAMYSGDVLEDDPYDDWYVPLREEARSVYLSVVRRLAELRRDAGDVDDAIRLILRLLEREPYDEPAHLELVRRLSEAGRHGDARRRHQMYTERMRELDLEPQPFPT